MARLLGIDFIPLQIPLKRRLQMLAVVIHILTFSSVPLVCVAFSIYVFFFTSFWWLALGYFSWMFYDIVIRRTSSCGGRRSEWIRNSSYMKAFRDYFPISLEKTVDLDPNKNYIIGSHPHGILGCGAICNFGSNATGFSTMFPGITPYLVTLSANFRWPLLRGYVLWMGLCDSSKESISWITQKQNKGNAAVIVIGGAAEALEAKPGNYKLTLKNRKGFVKIAIRNGASLVPVYSFGENDLFCQASNERGTTLRAFQERFKSILGFSPPFFYGRGVFNYTFGFVPFRKPIVTIVGKPIPTVQQDSPSDELINKLHEQYIEGLSEIFEENKARFGINKDKKLTFI